MSDKVSQELLEALRDRLEMVLDSEMLDGEELANAYVDQGYIDALLNHNIAIDKEEYETLLQAIESYEEICKC